MATSPYIIPEKINDYILASNQRHDIDINAFYVSEKNMADRFKRHIKNRMDKEAYFQRQDGNVKMTVGEHEFDIIKENKPTCAAGNAATFRAIRYRISSNKVFDNYTSHIGVFPLCSRVNVLNGYRAAATFTITFPCLPYWFSSANPVLNDIFVPAGYVSLHSHDGRALS